MASLEEIDPLAEKQYLVRLLRDDFPQIIESWQHKSAEFQRCSERQLDIELGRGACKLDVFYCGEPQAPLLIFLHGGYWQAGDKSYYSFIAAPFVEDGVDVAIMAYPLCPAVSMTQLVNDVMNAIASVFMDAHKLGVCASRINIAGHSAGGQLAGVAHSTIWPQRGYALPGDLIKSAIAISGLYELAPLLKTSLNHALKMDETQAKQLSPLSMQSTSRVPMLLALGAAETNQFHWQADQYAMHLQAQGVKLEKHIEPGVDHFDILDSLSSANSVIYQKIRAWLQ